MSEKPKIRTRNVNAKLTAQDLGWKQGYNQKVITVSPKKVTFSDWSSDFKYPFIGRSVSTGKVVFFDRIECGVEMLTGRKYSDWCMDDFEDVTKEYLNMVKSKSHADFIADTTENFEF